jgi:O-antigen/teichoic acid export membrane protein
MSTVQRIARNTTALLAAQVVSYLLAFFYMIYIARYLGPASFGILSFAIAFTAIFGVFADLGLSPLMTREVARNKSLVMKYIANVSLMKMILVAVTFGLIALTVNLLGYPEETIRVVYLLGLNVVLAAFSQMFYAVFQAFERMEFQAIGQMLSAALMLGGVVLAIRLGFSILGLASVYVMAGGVVLAYSFTVARLKFSNPAPASAIKVVEFDWSFCKPVIKEALPFGLSAIFVSVYFWIDTVMLSLMKGDVVVGWYNAAYRMVYVLLFIPAAYFTSLYPLMSRLFESSQESLKLAYERSARYMLGIGLPLALGTSLLADRVILLIYGAGYAPAVAALRILIWAIFFSYLSHAPAYTLNSMNKQKIYTYVVSFSMVLNIVLNLLLIPGLSYAGASIATVATEFVAFGLLFGHFRRLFGTRPPFKFLIKVSISAAVMAVFVILCGRFMNLGWLALIAAAIYFTLMFLSRALSREEISLLKELISLPRDKSRG